MTVESESALIQELGAFDTATLHEAQGRTGAMDWRIKPVYQGMKLLGVAVPVWCHPADNLAIHRAVAQARPGDVLVVDAGGYVEAGHWGEVLTAAAQARGVAGLVIDGGVRDIQAVRRRGFSLFARGVSMRAAVKEQPGRVNEPVICGGVHVRPGDFVIGDDDGVVIVARERAAAVLAAAREREAKEARVMELLQGGKTTLELLGLTDLLRRKGAL